MKTLAALRAGRQWLLLFVFCLNASCMSSCGEDPTVYPPGGSELRLEPGGRVFGVDGFAVHAPEGALEEAIWVTIDRVERPEARPLPEELEHAGFTYQVTTREALEFGRVPLVFEVPLVELRAEEELAGVFLSRASWREMVDTITHDDDLWTENDGRLSEDGERLALDVWTMPDEGHVVGLAHGHYFTHWPPERIDALEDELGPEPDVRRQGLGDVDFHIVCEGNADAFCNDIVAHTRNLLRRAYADFRAQGYREPRLKEVWFRSGTVYKYFFRRAQVGGGDSLCDYSVTQAHWSGARGRYEAPFYKATVCIFDTDRRGIRLFPGNFSPGERLSVQVGPRKYEYVVAAGDDGLGALRGLGGVLTGDSGVTWEVVDGMLYVRPQGHKRLATLTADYQGAGYLWWNRLDHYAPFTLRHEYYHALQFAYGPTLRSIKHNMMIIEGTAVAGERSLDQMVRSPKRNLRVVDAPLFFDAWTARPLDYRAQDFFVFLGRRINASVGFLTPLWERGAWLSDLDAFLREDYSPSESYSLAAAYWDWVKNQAIEKRVDIGHAAFAPDKQCSLSLQVVERLVKEQPADGEARSSEHTLAPLEARVAEFVLGPYGDNRAVELEAIGATSAVRTAFYDAAEAGTPDCHGRANASSMEVALAPGETRTIWIVAANISREETRNVTFASRFVDSEAPTVEITTPLSGSTLLEARPFMVGATVSLSTPTGWLRWSIEDDLVWEGRVAANQTFFIDRIERACPVGGDQTLRAVLTDERGLWTEDEVRVDIDALAAQQRLALLAAVGESGPESVLGSNVYLPMMPAAPGWRTPDVVLHAELEARQCTTYDDLDPAGFAWSRDGALIATGSPLRIDTEFFEIVNHIHQPATITVRHPQEPALSRELTLIPCNPYALQLEGPTPPFLQGFVACPKRGFTEGLRDRLFGEAAELFLDRREADIAMTLQERLDAVFDGNPPAFFPVDATGVAESMAHGTLTPLIYTWRWDLRNAESIAVARSGTAYRESLASLGTETRVELEFFLQASTLVHNTLDFFASAETGGFDGWWLIGDTVTGASFTEGQIIELAGAALDGFMTGFAHQNPTLDIATPGAVERGTQASIVATLMHAASLVP